MSMVKSCSTALNKRILIASFTTPSPNNIEFNVGNWFSLMIVNAATVSVAHNTAASRRHSFVFNNSGSSPEWRAEFQNMIKADRTTKEMIVPSIPKRVM